MAQRGRLALSVWTGIGPTMARSVKLFAQFIDSAAAAEFCSSRQVPSKDELQRLARDAGFCDAEVRVSLPVPAVPPVTKLILL